MTLAIVAIGLFVLGVVVHRTSRGGGFVLMALAIACGALYSLGGV